MGADFSHEPHPRCVVRCHSGAYGATNSRGELIKKTFQWVTNSGELAEALSRKLSTQELIYYAPIYGSETRRSGEYPRGMIAAILHSSRSIRSTTNPPFSTQQPSLRLSHRPGASSRPPLQVTGRSANSCHQNHPAFSRPRIAQTAQGDSVQPPWNYHRVRRRHHRCGSRVLRRHAFPQAEV